MRWRCRLALVAALSGLLPSSAYAEREPTTSGERRSAKASKPRYWQGGKSRAFVAPSVMVGLPSGASLFAGYGKPRWIWAGAEATLLATPSFAAFAGGIRAEALLLNGLFRVRRTVTFKRHFAPIQQSYEKEDFEISTQPRANYTSLDAWLWGVIPAGPTLGIWAARGVKHLGLPDRTALFSEMVRTPLVADRALLLQGLWFLKLASDKVMVGPAVDAVLTPERPTLVRAGGGVMYSFGDHLDLRAIVTLAVNSPDSLGFVSTAYGAAFLRWMVATGESEPGFL